MRMDPKDKGTPKAKSYLNIGSIDPTNIAYLESLEVTFDPSDPMHPNKWCADKNSVYDWNEVKLENDGAKLSTTPDKTKEWLAKRKAAVEIEESEIEEPNATNGASSSSSSSSSSNARSRQSQSVHDSDEDDETDDTPVETPVAKKANTGNNKRK